MTSSGAGSGGVGVWSRRAAIGGLAAAGLGFVLLGPRGAKEAAAGGRIVLDYWEKWTRHEGDAMVKVVEAFNASQDRIRVRYFVTSDIGQKSLIAIAGGDPPDLIGLYAFNVPPYAEAGAILPLDELAPKFGVRLENYAQGVRGVMQHAVDGVKDRWWASVNTAGSVALYYNRSLFKSAGLDPDRPPRTIAELDEAHRKLVKVNGKDELERVGFLHREPGWWSWLWAYHFDGRIYDPASDRSLVASPENVRAMEWMQGYARDLGVDRVKKFQEGFGNYFTPENPFLTGKVAMIVQGPWIANLIQAFKPDMDYGVAPFPTVSGYAPDAPVGLIDTDVLVIPRGARHPEASMEFIAWTQRPDMTELLATAHCKPSPLAHASEAFLANHPNKGIRVHYEIFNSPRAFIAPPTRVWQQFKDEFDTAVQKMWRLEQPAAKVLAELETRTQGLIDRAAGERRRRRA
jgi:ABC-type glycerol-3-phosphate transport system substrate-binding protein